MGKEKGWKNLELGRGWNKGNSNKIELPCAICGKTVKKHPSQIKSKNVFCCPEHKAEGMRRGLVSPMRLGTGRSKEDKNILKRYWHYRVRDKSNGFKTTELSPTEFLNLIKNSKCCYCGTIENLGFDRIDNSKGHSNDNIVISCELCNMTKGNRFTVEEMKKIGKIICEIKIERGERTN